MRRAGQPVATDASGGGLSLGDGDGVRGGEALNPDGSPGADIVALHYELECSSGRCPLRWAVELQHGDSVEAGVGRQPIVAGDVAVVEHDDQALEPLRQLGVAGETASLSEVIG
ncbi:Uncharacterised protein [Mycobacteroides abscessus subsp. massiliense]|nr:Uncharacterised protein [Mycobacteroides abscessus subsp. massiliense]